jgi:rare lipoprotein A
MYAMTAAHKTLPLPTYVRVRNLKNNRTIVVRVNDRGPFIDNRIIDLSYSAALKLDMVRDGTSLVEITALSYDEPIPRDNRVATSSPVVSRESEIFVQVGAFGDRSNAKRRYDLLRKKGISEVTVHKDTASSPALYRIRIGPIDDVAQYDVIVEQLAGIGISDSHLITAE